MIKNLRKLFRLLQKSEKAILIDKKSEGALLINGTSEEAILIDKNRGSYTKSKKVI